MGRDHDRFVFGSLSLARTIHATNFTGHGEARYKAIARWGNSPSWPPTGNRLAKGSNGKPKVPWGPEGERDGSEARAAHYELMID